MRGPLSNEVVSFSSRGPFILYALLWGVGGRGEGTGMTCKQGLNQTRSFQRGKEKVDISKMRAKYFKISTW